MARTTESWAAMEFKGIDLGDKRLNRRAILLAEQLSGSPTASISSGVRRLGRDGSGLSVLRAGQVGMDRRHGATLAELDRADAGMRGGVVPG
jgi:hypothetical protein